MLRVSCFVSCVLYVLCFVRENVCMRPGLRFMFCVLCVVVCVLGLCVVRFACLFRVVVCVSCVVRCV